MSTGFGYADSHDDLVIEDLAVGDNGVRDSESGLCLCTLCVAPESTVTAAATRAL